MCSRGFSRRPPAPPSTEKTMPKAKSGKATTPNKLAKVGKKTAVELSESQLDKVSGGLARRTDGYK